MTLTPREFDLLAFLARNPRRVFTREQIMQSVWGYTAAIDTGTRRRCHHDRATGAGALPTDCHAAARTRASMAAEGSSAAVACE